MAKRKSTPASTPSAQPQRSAASGDTIEDRVLAFAENLGWMAGTIQSKAGAAVDRKALQTQLTSVRDGAKQLLAQLAKAARRQKAAPAPASKPRRTTTRSGGTVDAPGKSHRKPAPIDALSVHARARAANVRDVRPAMKKRLPRARG